MDNEIFICKYCDKEFHSPISFGSHVFQAHKKKIKEYYDLFLKKENEGKCCCCGKDTKFEYITTGYRKFCSIKCSSIGYIRYSADGQIKNDSENYISSSGSNRKISNNK